VSKKNLIKNLQDFKCQVWTTDLVGSRTQSWDSLDTLVCPINHVFIIFHKNCMPKISELKKPSAKVKIYNLINYSTVCCHIRSEILCKTLIKAVVAGVWVEMLELAYMGGTATTFSRIFFCHVWRSSLILPVCCLCPKLGNETLWGFFWVCTRYKRIKGRLNG